MADERKRYLISRAKRISRASVREPADNRIEVAILALGGEYSEGVAILSVRQALGIITDLTDAIDQIVQFEPVAKALREQTIGSGDERVVVGSS